MYQFKFQIDLQGNLRGQTHLKLFNGYNELLFDGYGEIDMFLEKGIYFLWIEINEHTEERHYRINKDRVDVLNQISNSSSMPLSGMTSTHEYFSNPAKLWSEEITNTQKEQAGGHFFLFLRYEDEQVPFDQSFKILKQFTLLNDKRKPVIKFNEKNSKIDFGKSDQYFGSIAFNTSLKKGQYYLIYQEKSLSREIPFYVFLDFQTQVFFNIKKVPIFSSLKISISKTGFEGHSPQNQQLNGLILKLFNGIILFPSDLKAIANKGNWENIMLAFLGLYMYLLSSKKKDKKFYEEYLEHLENLLPKDKDAPEFKALRLLASVVFKQKIPTKTLVYPTMIAKGMEVYLKQSIENERLIKKDSMVQQILVNLKTDSIWTTYEVLPEHKVQIATRTIKSHYMTRGSLNPRSGNAILLSSSPRFNRKEVIEVKTIQPVIEDTKWITETILHELANPRIENLKVKDLAIQLQVTQNSIRKSLHYLKGEDTLKKMQKKEVSFKKMDIDSVLNKIKKMK